MGALKQDKQKETPIPGFPGWTEEELEREVEEIESDDFDFTVKNWVIRVGPGPHRGDLPQPWQWSVRVPPAEYDELRREAKGEGISVNELVERQIAEDVAE
jgi:hypothetical protein